MHIGPSDVYMIYQISKEDYEMLLSKNIFDKEELDKLNKHFLCGESSYCKRNKFSIKDINKNL